MAEAQATGRTGAALKFTADQLRRGQLSFALFGHPYEWSGGVQWKKINVGEVLQESDRAKVADKLTPVDGRSYPFLGASSPDTSVTYRNWPYEAAVYSSAVLDPRRLVAPYSGSVTFLPNIAHTSPLAADGTHTIFDGSPGAKDVPASTSPFPSVSSLKGTWLNPATGQQWPANVDISQINSNTLCTYRADSDFEPAAGTPLYQLTQGAPISYRRGYPDFSGYTDFVATLNPMRGDETRNSQGVTDFSRGDAQFENSPQFAHIRNQGMTVDQWIRTSTNYTTPMTIVVPPTTGNRPNWVWHHHQDMRHIQMVPSVLNTPTFGGIHHTGGASWAELSRW